MEQQQPPIQIARSFPYLFNNIETPKCVEIALNTMTADWDPASVATVEGDEELPSKQIYLRITDDDLIGACRGLFTKVMMGLVRVGNPLNLKIGWVEYPSIFEVEGEKVVGCEIGVLDHPAFYEDWENSITTLEEIRQGLSVCGIRDLGAARIAVQGQFKPMPHVWTTPVPVQSMRSLYVSLMSQIYDMGEPTDLELRWFALPSMETRYSSLSKNRTLFIAKALVSIVKGNKIVLASAIRQKH